MGATENTEDTEMEEKEGLTEQILGAAMDVHRMLGPGSEILIPAS
jgi:hypothetical protein